MKSQLRKTTFFFPVYLHFADFFRNISSYFELYKLALFPERKQILTSAHWRQDTCIIPSLMSKLRNKICLILLITGNWGHPLPREIDWRERIFLLQPLRRWKKPEGDPSICTKMTDNKQPKIQDLRLDGKPFLVIVTPKTFQLTDRKSVV